MLNSSPSQTQDNDEGKKSLNDLPKSHFWKTREIRRWEGFWFSPRLINPSMTFRSTFQARDEDVFLASTMKAGTTWLKSLTLCIMQKAHPKTSINSDHLHKQDDILTTANPHFHVPTIETMIYATKPPEFDIYDASAPRLLHTHLPYAVLPDSIKSSACKIVYITRSPKDSLISMWHFFNSIFTKDQDPFPLEKAVDCFCSGEHQYGPFFDHVVEYWQESRKRPEKILFLKYEDLKRDPKARVTKIAEFLGRPFGDDGEVDDVLWRCSLERMRNLEVNKSGSVFMDVPNNTYFRKGEVGDWKNYLTPEMEERIDQMSRNQLETFGLFF